jgi:hypothetical protein
MMALLFCLKKGLAKPENHVGMHHHPDTTLLKNLRIISNLVGAKKGKSSLI